MALLRAVTEAEDAVADALKGLADQQADDLVEWASAKGFLNA